MGQRDKLHEDISNALEWLNDENFRDWVMGIVEDRPLLVKRLQKEIARAEKKLLTSR